MQPPRPASDLFSVAGKTVVVTGGGRGIGRSLAQGFAIAGATVFICGRKREPLEQAATELAHYGDCRAIPADLSTLDGCSAFATQLAAHTTSLDVLINNAGALWAAPLSEYPESGWDKVFNVNVKGPFFLVQALLPMLVAAASADDPSRIITVGSIDAFHVPAHETYGYTASKAAVHQLARHLAKSLAVHNITSNVIAPGMFRSQMMEETIARRGEEAVLERVPLKRFVESDDMVGAAVYLASRAGSCVTGAVLPVDGGTATTL